MIGLDTKTIDGVDYYHIKGIPVVKEMVLNGAFLPLPEIKKTIEAWNMKPVVFGHPKEGSMMVSASKENQIGNHYGFATNAVIDKNRMRADFYLKKIKIDGSDEGRQLLQKVKAGIEVNVSTAYFPHHVPGSGKSGGKDFGKIQTDISPDHIAILLNEDGACNTRDGCGINVNHSKGTEMTTESTEVKEEVKAEEVAAVVAPVTEPLSGDVIEAIKEAVIAANAASASGSTQSFATCMAAIDEIKGRLDKMDKYAKKPKKKKEVAANDDDADEDDSSMAGNSNNENSEPASEPGEKAEEATKEAEKVEEVVANCSCMKTVEVGFSPATNPNMKAPLAANSNSVQFVTGSFYDYN